MSHRLSSPGFCEVVPGGARHAMGHGTNFAPSQGEPPDDLVFAWAPAGRVWPSRARGSARSPAWFRRRLIVGPHRPPSLVGGLGWPPDFFLEVLGDAKGPGLTGFVALADDLTATVQDRPAPLISTNLMDLDHRGRAPNSAPRGRMIQPKATIVPATMNRQANSTSRRVSSTRLANVTKFPRSPPHTGTTFQTPARRVPCRPSPLWV